MWLIVGIDTYNLDHFHRIFPGEDKRSVSQSAPENRRLYMEMKAGGAQEADARRILEFQSMDERDEALLFIQGALEAGLPAFNLLAQFQEVQAEAKGEPMTPMLQEAWRVISNAYDGQWEDAPDLWRARAEIFRDHLFNKADPDA